MTDHIKFQFPYFRLLNQKSREATREVMRSHFPNYLGSATDEKIRERFPIRISQADMSKDQNRW